MRKVLLLALFVFLLGWTGSNAYNAIGYDVNVGEAINQESPLLTARERDSPKDRVAESQIHVYDDLVIIELEDPEWSTFSDTNSMDPFLDKGSNAIHVVPQYPGDLQAGDIVAYDSDFSQGTVIHRIIEVGQDEQGVYYIMKGDNNPSADPGKVRFEQIKRVLVAIIY